jgi:hypothetical protein
LCLCARFPAQAAVAKTRAVAAGAIPLRKTAPSSGAEDFDSHSGSTVRRRESGQRSSSEGAEV